MQNLFNILKNNNLDKGTFIGLIAIILWSTAASAFKIALNTFSVFQVLLISTFVSTCIFLIYEIVIYFFFKKNIFPKLSFKLVILSILNPFLYYLLLFQAYSILPAQLALTLNYLWPIILTILFILTKKINLDKNLVYSILISFFGFLILTTKGNLQINFHINNFDSKYLFGVGLALLSAFVWAYYWLLNSNNEVIETDSNSTKKNDNSLFLNFSLSFIYLIIYGILFKYNEIIGLFNFNNDTTIDINNGVLSSIYIGCFEMGFTFLLWKYAVSNSYKKEVLTNIVYLSPVLSLVWISILLNEEIYFTTYLGFILILSGIFFQNIKDNFHKLKK